MKSQKPKRVKLDFVNNTRKKITGQEAPILDWGKLGGGIYGKGISFLIFFLMKFKLMKKKNYFQFIH